MKNIHISDFLPLIKEMESKDRCLGIEIKVSEKFGFVGLVVMDLATGDTIDLDLQLNSFQFTRA